MVKIRLRRTGATKKPSYRVVVADARAARNGAFIEIIGHYNPLTDPATVVIDKEKALAWLSKGAQPTDTVARLLVRAGIKEDLKLKMSAPRQKKKAKAEAQPAPRQVGAPSEAQTKEK
jgi:small subunit ribosomal protein S16